MNKLKKIYCRSYQVAFKLAMPFLPYKEPIILNDVQLITSVLKKKKISKVLLVTDKTLRTLKLTEKLENHLALHQISCVVYDETVQNPNMKNVLDATALYHQHQAQAIIGFGGGSPMDCAKCVGAKVARPKLKIEKMHGVLKVLKKTPLFFAVPTTSGTGSEVTITSVITNEKTKQKYTINDFALIPDYAVHDYNLTINLPSSITAATGMDALTHAVEAYIGRSTNATTRKLAENAITLINQHLLECVNNPTNVESRSAMQLAAYQAGIAFSRSYVGYVHALSHAISGRYHTAHGVANACILPYFLDEYKETIDHSLAKLAKMNGLATENTSSKQAADCFRNWVWDMNEKLGIPKKLSEIKSEHVSSIVSFADKEANPLYPVPKLMGKQELETMLKKIME